VPGPHVYFATAGTQTIRVQEREDGPAIDQIVISPDTYLIRSPGWERDDQTIVPQGEALPPTNAPPTASLTAPASGATFTAPATITLGATASDPENRLARVEFFNGSTRLNSDGTAPYSYTWSGVAAGTYQLRAVAVDMDGASGSSTTVTVSVSPPTTNQPPTVALTAPTNGATFTAPATITFSATASDPENRLARVEFFNGATRLSTDTTAPFGYTWSGVPAGTYQVRAIAFDADGASTASTTATITVSTASTTTKRVAFTASASHATLVTSYLLEVFQSTANPLPATALASSNLGKPTPSATGEIIVDQTTFLNGLAPGNYLVTVAAVGPGGKSRSTAITFTR
jgi:predicted phage tail protein